MAQESNLGPLVNAILFQSIFDSTLIETCNIAQNASLNDNGPPIQLIQSDPFFNQTQKYHLCKKWLEAFLVRTFPHKKP